MQFSMSSNFQMDYSIELVLIWGWKKWYGLSKLAHRICFNNNLKYEIFAESALFSSNFVGFCGPILTNHTIFFNLKSRLIQWNDPFGNLRTSKIAYFSGWSFLYRKRHIWSTFDVISQKLRLQIFLFWAFYDQFMS